jgi:hypothetical protein
MEIAKCVHKEHLKNLGNHQELGTCEHCHQEVLYDRSEPKMKIFVKKLGRIGDKIVFPNLALTLDLKGKDAADLRLARMSETRLKHPLAEEAPASEKKEPQAIKEQEAITAPVTGIPPRPNADDPRGRLRWLHTYKKQLIADLLQLGEKAFLEKYNLTPQFLGRLKRDKHYKKLAKEAPAPAAEKKPKSRSIQAKAPGGSRADMPKWNEDWPSEVKVAWLEAFGKIHS